MSRCGGILDIPCVAFASKSFRVNFVVISLLISFFSPSCQFMKKYNIIFTKEHLKRVLEPVLKFVIVINIFVML